MADKEVKIKITADTGDLDKDLKKASGRLSKFARAAGSGVKGLTTGVTKFAKTSLGALGSLGKGIVAVGTVYTGTLIGIAKAYSSYEKALAGVGKTANMQGKELRQFGKDFKEATKDIPVATNELLGFAQRGAQLKVAREDLGKFATTIARLKVSVEGLDIDQAILSIAGTVQLMEGSSKNVDRFASTVALMGDTFSTTEAKILHSTQSIASGISRFHNVSTPDVIALATATSTVKIEAENARTQFQRTFQALTVAIKKGGKPLDDLIKLTGKSGEELQKAYGESATNAFELFVEGLSKIKQEDLPAELEKYGLGGERAITVLGTLANKGLPVLRDALKRTSEEYITNTKLTNESNIAFGTLGSLTTLVWKRITDLTTAVGEKLAPAFKSIAKRATAFFDSLSDTKTVDAISDAFLIMMGIGEDAIKGIAGVGKSILKWFGGDGDVSKSLKTFRKLMEMGKLWTVLKLTFQKALIDIEIAFDKFLKSIGKKIDDFFTLSLTSGFEKGMKGIAKVAGKDIAKPLNPYIQKQKEIAELQEKISRNTDRLRNAERRLQKARESGDDKKVGREEKRISRVKENIATMKEEQEQMIKALEDGTIAKNEAKETAFESENEKDLSLAERSIAKQEEIDVLLKEAKEKLKVEEEEEQEEEEEDDEDKPIDPLNGDPERNQENVDKNLEIQEEGRSTLLEGMKAFFGMKGELSNDDVKNAKTDDQKKILLASATGDALLKAQAAFGMESGALARAFGLTKVAINTGEAISNAIASVKGTSGYDFAIQLALAVGSVMSAIAPAAPMIKGGRQEGGEVTGGDSFLVGERGAEVFTPQVDGNIIPNDALGGQTVQVVVTGGDDFARTLNYDIQDQKELGTVAR